MELTDYSPELVNYIRDQLQYRWDMAWAMEYNERLIGVPYGPALCEIKGGVTMKRILVILEMPDWMAWGETPEELAQSLITANGEYSPSAEVVEAVWWDD